MHFDLMFGTELTDKGNLYYQGKLLAEGATKSHVKAFEEGLVVTYTKNKVQFRVNSSGVLFAYLGVGKVKQAINLGKDKRNKQFFLMGLENSTT